MKEACSEFNQRIITLVTFFLANIFQLSLVSVKLYPSIRAKYFQLLQANADASEESKSKFS